MLQRITTNISSPIGSDFNSQNGSYNQIPSPSLTPHQHQQSIAMGDSANSHATLSNNNPSDMSKVPSQFNTNNDNSSPLLSPPPPPPPSALSTLLQHPPPPLFSPGNCGGTSMQTNHHQSSPISVASGIHEIMMQPSTPPLNAANSHIHDSNHLVPPPLHSTASSSDCYTPIGSHSRSLGSPNRLSINNNNHSTQHSAEQIHHSITHLEHHLQQLQQQPPKHNSESNHTNQQSDDTVYSHTPEYISL